MKKNSSILLLTFSSLIIFLFACEKGGPGGSGYIKGQCIHHTTIVPWDTIGIKYNATQLPGVTQQDYDAITHADSTGHFSFGPLKKGNYYLYGWGYDSTRAVGVTGGQAVKLTSNSDVDNMILYITEGD
jgi:hypothetical protein